MERQHRHGDRSFRMLFCISMRRVNASVEPMRASYHTAAEKCKIHLQAACSGSRRRHCLHFVSVCLSERIFNITEVPCIPTNTDQLPPWRSFRSIHSDVSRPGSPPHHILQTACSSRRNIFRFVFDGLSWHRRGSEQRTNQEAPRQGNNLRYEDDAENLVIGHQN